VSLINVVRNLEYGSKHAYGPCGIKHPLTCDTLEVDFSQMKTKAVGVWAWIYQRFWFDDV